MKKFITILGVAVIAALTVNAGLVTSWSDDFTATDGTVVAPGANWEATNIVWQQMGPSWSTFDRASNNDDVYIISNNQFYTFIGPCTLYTNVSVNQKVQASFIPQEAGERIGLDLANGIVTLEVDLEDMWGNEGNKWDVNLEIKISLPCAPIITDTHQVTNYYQISIKKFLASEPNYTIYGQFGSAGVNAASFVITNYPNLDLHKTIKLTVQNVAGDAVAKLYVNDDLVGSTNGVFTAAEMATLYPYIWEGRFSGDNAEVSDGALFLDNYSVNWAPPVPAIDVSGVADFGSVLTSDYKTNDFTISNSGGTNLFLSGTPIVAVDNVAYSIIQPAFTNITSGSNVNFSIIFKPDSPGIVTGNVSIANNDLTNNPYLFEVIGEGVEPLNPEIEVTPMNYDFGQQATQMCSGEISITITNSGNAVLYITSVSHDNSNFTLTQPGETNIASGSFTTFGVDFCPTMFGSLTGNVIIANNDSDENPTIVEVTGIGVPEPSSILLALLAIPLLRRFRK